MSKRPPITENRAPFIGQWRIMSADCFDPDYLDLCQEARLIVPPDGMGDMCFGALVAGLTFSFAPETLFFSWHGDDEMDESTGKGVMVLTATGKAEIELEYFNGDEVVLQAIRISGD